MTNRQSLLHIKYAIVGIAICLVAMFLVHWTPNSDSEIKKAELKASAYIMNGSYVVERVTFTYDQRNSVIVVILRSVSYDTVDVFGCSGNYRDSPFIYWAALRAGDIVSLNRFYPKGSVHKMYFVNHIRPEIVKSVWQ